MDVGQIYPLEVLYMIIFIRTTSTLAKLLLTVENFHRLLLHEKKVMQKSVFFCAPLSDIGVICPVSGCESSEYRTGVTVA